MLRRNSSLRGPGVQLMRTVWVVLVMASTPAWAGRKTVVLAAGDCADPSLISGAKDFRDTASKLLGAQLLEGEGVLDIVRPRPTRSIEDIQRQVDSARTLFYGGQPDRAAEQVERALTELERTSPEARPWAVIQAALVLQALVQKNLDHPKEMNDAFRRILRLDPTFKLDPDAHPPSAIAALDAVKKDLARARKSPLLVRVDTGPAATVFVDGLALGSTPLKLDLVPGTYRISLTAPGMVSFPHRVELPRDSKLGVDLAFEGSLGLQPPLCLSGADDGTSIKLGQLVAAQSVIILRNTAKRGAPPFLSGTLFDLSSGQQERGGAVAPELLANLATFLVTGKEQAGIQVSGPKVEAKEPVATAPAKPEPPAPPPIDPRQPTFDVATGASPGRVTSFALMGVGGAAVLAGIISYSVGGADRERLAGITRVDGKLPLYALPVGKEALGLMTAIDTNRALSFSLIGGGVGAFVAGLVGFIIFPASTTHVSVSAAPGGALMQVSGSF